MDIVKDVRKTTDFSKFIESQAVKTNPFGQNSSGQLAYRRAERLVAAIYLLTNHIADTEPLRGHIRALSGELLPAILLLRDGFRASGGTQVRSVHACIRELISHTRILAISGFISFQNAETVVEALDELGYFLSASQRSLLAESVVLTHEDLVPRAQAVQKVPDTVSVMNPQRTKEKIKDIKDNRTIRTEASRTDSIGQHTERFDAVLEVLQTGGLLSIRDIAIHFPEYSEKTVQRLLADMVQQGVVRHEGMKRWRRYALKK